MDPAHDPPGDVTRLLREARDGGEDAASLLIQRLYGELKMLAAAQLRGERPDHTLSTTALVHEAYMKVASGLADSWDDRAHFFGAAARAMRQVLVDHARARDSQKRGGAWRRTTLSGRAGDFTVPLGEVLELDAALDRLDGRSPRLRQVVEMRFFGGMTEEEIGRALDVTSRTVQRDWAKARAWLYAELHPSDA